MTRNSTVITIKTHIIKLCLIHHDIKAFVSLPRLLLKQKLNKIPRIGTFAEGEMPINNFSAIWVVCLLVKFEMIFTRCYEMEFTAVAVELLSMEGGGRGSDRKGKLMEMSCSSAIFHHRTR